MQRQAQNMDLYKNVNYCFGLRNNKSYVNFYVEYSTDIQKKNWNHSCLYCFSIQEEEMRMPSEQPIQIWKQMFFCFNLFLNIFFLIIILEFTTSRNI